MANPHPLKVLACEQRYGYHHVKWHSSLHALRCCRCGFPQGMLFHEANLVVEYVGTDPQYLSIDAHKPATDNFQRCATLEDALAYLGVTPK